MSDQILTTLFTFVVTAIVARYLGPSSFGTLAYAFALATLFGVIGKLGLEGIVVRELVTQKDEQARILGTTLAMKGCAYLLSAGAIVVYANAVVETPTERSVIYVAALFIILTPLSTTSYWFHANVLGRYQAISNISGYFVSGIVRLGFVYFSASLILFAFANVLQTLTASFIALIYFVLRGGPSLARWRPSWKMAKRLLSEGWAVFLGGIFGVIYLKIDQVMLRWLTQPEEVGVYAVAAKISEATYFIPAAIMASIFPKLLELKDSEGPQYTVYLRSAFDVMTLLSLAIIFFIFFIGQEFINLVFGSAYYAAGSILIIHIMATPFIFMRTVFSRWILIEKLSSFLLVSQGLGALLNIALNLLLIPQFAGIGAAISTVFSYAAASYFALILSRRTRPIFLMMTSSLFTPWRSARRLYFLKGGDSQKNQAKRSIN